MADGVDGLAMKPCLYHGKRPHKAFQVCSKAHAQGIRQEGRRESTLFLSELTKKNQKKKAAHFLSGITEMEYDVLLTEEHIFSTMIY